MVFAHLPVAGLYSSALDRSAKLVVMPPVIRTWPFGSSDAADLARAKWSDPVAENERVAGLYSSALASGRVTPIWPPAISTSPFFSKVAVKSSRGLVIGPTGTNESGPAPYPVTAGPCGLSGALSDTAVVALRSEMELGAKRTRTVHVPPGATGALLQLVPTRKSPGFLPVTAVPLTTRLAEPALVTR